jgi:hypothetical protein
MSDREAIWKAMQGQNGLTNLTSGNPATVLPAGPGYAAVN